MHANGGTPLFTAPAPHGLRDGLAFLTRPTWSGPLAGGPGAARGALPATGDGGRGAAKGLLPVVSFLAGGEHPDSVRDS